MHAFLITGGSPEERNKRILQILSDEKIHESDCLRLEPEEGSTVTVESVRSFIKQLLLSPRLSSKTAGIIPNADLMTIQSQNALLKTLEEPPPHSIILIHCASSSGLLETIISRCSHITLAQNTGEQGDTMHINNLLNMKSLSVGKRLLFADSFAGTREETTARIDAAIVALHASVVYAVKNVTAYDHIIKIIRSLMFAKRKLHLNIAPKTVLDSVVLDFQYNEKVVFPD